MRDLDQFPGRRTDVVLLDHVDQSVLYGHRLLEETRSSGLWRETAVYWVSAAVYAAYLKTHFPNYPAVQRLLQLGRLDHQLLRTISYQIRFERGDADYIMAGKHLWQDDP